MTDAKISTLVEKYHKYGSVRNLPASVESQRKRATLLGAGTSLAIFLVNEASRFTLRSPLFKVKPAQALLVLVGPTAYFKWVSNGEIEEKVDQFWRIHKNREEFDVPNFINVQAVNQNKHVYTGNLNELLYGTDYDYHSDSSHLMSDEDKEEFPDLHEDIDREKFSMYVKVPDRHKVTGPKEGTTAMNWFVGPYMDEPVVPEWGGPDGWTFFHTPQDSMFGPTVDHGIAERSIWNFRKSIFGTPNIMNEWAADWREAVKDPHSPHWFGKMIMPSFYDQKLADEFMLQMAARREFSILKKKWNSKIEGPETEQDRRERDESYKQFVDKAQEEKCRCLNDYTFSTERCRRGLRD